MKSASNNEIKLLRKLAKKKYRDREKRFIVEGERAVEQVLDNEILRVEDIFISESILRSGYPADAKHIEHDLFLELADTDQTQGILAVCAKPESPDVEDLTGRSGMIVATDAIQDPGNMGTLIRTACWYNSVCFIAGTGSVDIYHPKVVRSTAGATGSIPSLHGDLPEILTKLKESGWTVLLLDGGDGALSLTEAGYPDKLVLVVGNEGNGISEELRESGHQRVKIGSRGTQNYVESLNAAIAAAIAMNHFGMH